MKKNIKEEIKKFIISELKEMDTNEDIEYLKDDTQLIENGFIDSMMILSLLAFIEENYGVILSSNELKPENFSTIEKISELIEKKID